MGVTLGCVTWGWGFSPWNSPQLPGDSVKFLTPHFCTQQFTQYLHSWVCLIGEYFLSKGRNIFKLTITASNTEWLCTHPHTHLATSPALEIVGNSSHFYALSPCSDMILAVLLHTTCRRNLWALGFLYTIPAAPAPHSTHF